MTLKITYIFVAPTRHFQTHGKIQKIIFIITMSFKPGLLLHGKQDQESNYQMKEIQTREILG